MTPVSLSAAAEQRIYRKVSYGPLLDVFMIDLRSYRGPNTTNDQPAPSELTKFLGRQQIDWLKQELKQSKATWKVISSDMPIGLIVRDGSDNFENGANGDGPALGRELDIAELLKSIKDNNVTNTVWLTADVHYAAAHYYSPETAVYKDFNPFWEFVSGPLHAGTFGPNALDNTFGPKVVWNSIPEDLDPNRSPLDGFQFYGEVSIDAQTKAMTVRQFNLKNEELFRQEIPAN